MSMGCCFYMKFIPWRQKETKGYRTLPETNNNFGPQTLGFMGFLRASPVDLWDLFGIYGIRP